MGLSGFFALIRKRPVQSASIRGMSPFDLPIVEQWRESFQTFKDDGRPVTVQGGAWILRDADIIDVQKHIVVLDIPERMSTTMQGARELLPASRIIVSLDAIAGISFERHGAVEDEFIPAEVSS